MNTHVPLSRVDQQLWAQLPGVGDKHGLVDAMRYAGHQVNALAIEPFLLAAKS